MRVQVTITGHQHARGYCAELLAHSQTVEHFRENWPLQVPALVLKKDGGEIIVQPLKREFYVIEVSEISGRAVAP